MLKVHTYVRLIKKFKTATMSGERRRNDCACLYVLRLKPYNDAVDARPVAARSRSWHPSFAIPRWIASRAFTSSFAKSSGRSSSRPSFPKLSQLGFSSFPSSLLDTAGGAIEAARKTRDDEENRSRCRRSSTSGWGLESADDSRYWSGTARGSGSVKVKQKTPGTAQAWTRSSAWCGHEWWGWVFDLAWVGYSSDPAVRVTDATDISWTEPRCRFPCLGASGSARWLPFGSTCQHGPRTSLMKQHGIWTSLNISYLYIHI